tara:strand:- start:6219 stop:6530 length:312 start_codon:yes stop_codon:yes gene_type:complete
MGAKIMPGKQIIKKAADKAYEAHANDETGLALEPKKATKLQGEETKVKAEEEDRGVADILMDTESAQASQPQGDSPRYALDAQDMAEMDAVAPPMDLFTLYNL